jgi:hypothetical protein
MNNETDKKFLVSERTTKFRGLRCIAKTNVMLYTDIRSFFLNSEFYDIDTKNKLGDIQYNINPSFRDDIYNALEKMLINNEDFRVFMIFKDWVSKLDLSESLKQELIRVCSV